jgi:hypothetical protein
LMRWSVRRTLERLGILLACVYVAWLLFIDATYLALNGDEPLLTARSQLIGRCLHGLLDLGQIA